MSFPFPWSWRSREREKTNGVKDIDKKRVEMPRTTGYVFRTVHRVHASVL